LRQFELDGLLKGDISAEDQVSISWASILAGKFTDNFVS
jgi:hypothetical protein